MSSADKSHRRCTVAGCDSTHLAKGMCRKHYLRNYRGKDIHEERPTLEKRLWAKVKKSDQCWEWTGAKDKDGYGQISSGPRGFAKNSRVHRVSYEIHFGDIPSGMMVCHHCDNPSCVKPGHLFLGTAGDNAQDASRKGRMAAGSKNGKQTCPEKVDYGDAHWARRLPERVPRGEASGMAVLTEKNVEEAKNLSASGMSFAAIARIFKVSRTCISYAVRGKTWAHIGTKK